MYSQKYSASESTTLRRGVTSIQKVFKSIQNAENKKVARKPVNKAFLATSRSGEGGI